MEGRGAVIDEEPRAGGVKPQHHVRVAPNRWEAPAL